MNKTEDQLLIRWQRVFSDIPLPIIGGSTKSAGISGFVDYGKDMAALRDLLNETIFLIRIRDYTEAQRALTILERYIAIRKTQNWGYIFPHLSIDDVEQCIEQESVQA